MEIKFNNLHELKIAIEASKIEIPQFTSIREYENDYGQVSNYLVNLGQHYGKTLMADFTLLKFLSPEDFSRVPDQYKPYRGDAYNELLTSMRANTDKNKDNHTPASKAQTDAYEFITPNVKVHKVNEQVYITGFIIRKTILQEAPPQPPKRTRKKNPVKQAKKYMQQEFRTSTYRTFKLSKIKSIKINGQELILEL
jgi:hypothetical protein